MIKFSLTAYTYNTQEMAKFIIYYHIIYTYIVTACNKNCTCIIVNDINKKQIFIQNCETARALITGMSVQTIVVHKNSCIIYICCKCYTIILLLLDLRKYVGKLQIFTSKLCLFRGNKYLSKKHTLSLHQFSRFTSLLFRILCDNIVQILYSTYGSYVQLLV